MKLKDLLKDITIQGDVRISVWDENDEVEVTEVFAQEHLKNSDVRRLLDLNVRCLFAGLDNMLHIELDPSRKHLIHAR